MSGFKEGLGNVRIYGRKGLDLGSKVCSGVALMLE